MYTIRKGNSKQIIPESIIDIPGYEGLYGITNDYKIWSYLKLGPGGHDGKFLKSSKNKHGYFTVTFAKNKQRRTFLVHRLIAQIFIPNPDNKPEINHINSIRADNRLENLEWCTDKENSVHSYRNTDRQQIVRDTRGKKVMQLTKEGILCRTYDSIAQAEEITKARRSNIIACAKGKVPRAGGYFWKYLIA